MKAKRSVSLFFILGLVVAITGFVSPAMAQDAPSSARSSARSAYSNRAFTEALATKGGQIEEEKTPTATLPLASLRVSGCVFRPNWSDVGWDWGWASGSFGSIFATGANPDYAFEPFSTPVYLPQGSVIDSIRMFYYDNADTNCMGWFTAYDLYGTVEHEWSVESSGTAGNGYSDSAKINHTIDYSLYSYVLTWEPRKLGSTMMLHGFRIFYYPSGTRYGSALILSSPPP